MKRIGNLKERIVDLWNIEIATRLAKLNKSSRREVQLFMEHEAEYQSNIYDMLDQRTFTTAKYYIKTIYEPKRREIYILPFYPDRIVQHALMNVIEPYLDRRFYRHSYSCRPGKGIHSGSKMTRKMVRRNKFVWKGDVRKFYPSIDHDIMYGVIERVFKDDFVLWLCSDIIYSIDGETNLPIGNYCSQWFGNLYLNGLDEFVKHTLKIKDYIRYCDDFVLFSNDKSELQEARAAVTEWLLNERKMTLSKDDLFPIKHGVDFLGYRHFVDKVILRKTSTKRLKKRIAKLWLQLNNPALTEPELDAMLQSLCSSLGWINWGQTYNLKTALNMYYLESEIRYRRIMVKQGNRLDLVWDKLPIYGPRGEILNDKSECQGHLMMVGREKPFWATERFDIIKEKNML